MLNELPTDQNSHHDHSDRTTSLERRIMDLCAERELDRRNIVILEDLNRTLGNTIKKLTAAMNQRTNSTPMRLEKEFSISALAWNLQRSEMDRAYLTDMTIGQHQIIERQSHHIAVLAQQVDNLQCATKRPDRGHSSRDT